jgi:hypothetical protein
MSVASTDNYSTYDEKGVYKALEASAAARHCYVVKCICNIIIFPRGKSDDMDSDRVHLNCLCGRAVCYFTLLTGFDTTFTLYRERVISL